MGKSNKLAKSAIIIIIFSLGSKVLGFIREALIAEKFGSGLVTDAYFIALMATGLVAGLISEAIATTAIPILSEIETKEGKAEKINHTNNIINIILFVSIILVIIGTLGAPIIIKVLAKGFKGEQFELAVNLTRIGLPMILFSGVTGIITGYLQSEERFTSTALIGIPFNLAYIFFLLYLSTRFGISGLMITGIIAMASQLLIQLPEAKISGFKYKFKFNIRDKYMKKMLYLSLPVFISKAVNDLNAIVDKTLASSLISGSISALNYANKLTNLILGVFISAITTVIFPMLSRESNIGNVSKMKSIMGYGVNLILLITIPATVGMIILATPIVEIAFQKGEFDAIATIMTSKALVFYSVGLIGMSIRTLLDRVYYSLQDTRTPMVNGIIAVIFNIVLNLILVQFMGHSGLALATSIATIIATILMFYGLKKKIGSIGTLSYIKCGLKSGLASIIMGIVVYLVYNKVYSLLGISRLYNLISLLIAVGLAFIVYVALCYILGIEEIRDTLNRIRDRLRR